MAEQIVVLDFDVKSAMRKLTLIQKQEFPFAYTKSLTETAVAAKQAVGIQARRNFKLHSEFIPKNVKVQPALKKDFTQFGFAESAVFTGHKLDRWMGLQETGGLKKPFASGGKDTGKAIAIPASGLKSKSYKTKTGKVRSRWKPGALLKNFKGSSSFGKVRVRVKGSKTKKAFIIRGSGGTPMIVRRKSKSKYPLEVLYTFSSKPKIKPVWGFEKTVEFVANAVFERKFNRNFALALRS